MPRLLILTQYFPPEMGAPQARLSELAERLVDHEWDVEVLTALPNYPTGAVFAGYDPRRPTRERIGRIPTVRVPLYTAQSGFIRRLRSYFSFVASACRWGPSLCQRPDLVWVESPPLFIGLAAWWLARRSRCPYVFNVSDLWPESAVRMGVVRPGVATWLLTRFEERLYRRAAGVTGQSADIIASVRRRVPSVPTEVITNGVDPSRFDLPTGDDPEVREVLGPEPGPIFLYAGLLGLAQGLDQVLDLAGSLPAEAPCRFVLVGDGPERARLAARIAAEGLSRVRLAPAQPRERIPQLLAAADMALVTLGMTIPGAVPSKIYEAMAARRPILLVADGEAARRVEDAGAGLTVPPGDAAGLRAACLRLASDAAERARLGQAGRHAAETLYHRDRIAERLDAFLRRFVPAAPRVPEAVAAP